jgi:hypothetical protein
VKTGKLKSLPQDFNDIDEAAEFWHSSGTGIGKEGAAGVGGGTGGEVRIGAPQFKPRGPLYRRRGGASDKGQSSSTEGNKESKR